MCISLKIITSTEEVSNEKKIQFVQCNQLTQKNILKTKDSDIGICQTDVSPSLEHLSL